ncbi:uncharacterized protein LOC111023958 [Momordica charantia]|uniref:Uncharacterized protein LOC111023958 n=1 Tax=Momordica charantia TaxID=3673 RepID=A0A6J1DSQ0_MOMCH|nr:uncharacterized protein LOC111023958 [Momordica charantia]XP_022157183.1 uncharacterized protein LOC111023958 [Momordica charantia]
MALGELERKFEELKDINEKQESRVRYYETKVQNIVFGYLIFTRLFFFGISQTSSSFNCKDWWVILALSLLCSFIYFLLFLDAVAMLFRTQYQLDIICKELKELFQQILVSKNQDDVGLSMETGESSGGFEFGFHEKMLMLDHFRIVGRKVYIYFTVSALLAVTAIELYVSKYVLCN